MAFELYLTYSKNSLITSRARHFSVMASGMMVGVRMRAAVRVHVFVVLSGQQLVRRGDWLKTSWNVLLWLEHPWRSVGFSASTVRNSSTSGHGVLYSWY